MMETAVASKRFYPASKIHVLTFQKKLFYPAAGNFCTPLPNYTALRATRPQSSLSGLLVRIQFKILLALRQDFIPSIPREIDVSSHLKANGKVVPVLN
jgi:hypothetical protein